jgi:Effector-associated domain 11
MITQLEYDQFERFIVSDNMLDAFIELRKTLSSKIQSSEVKRCQNDLVLLHSQWSEVSRQYNLSLIDNNEAIRQKTKIKLAFQSIVNEVISLQVEKVVHEPKVVDNSLEFTLNIPENLTSFSSEKVLKIMTTIEMLLQTGNTIRIVRIQPGSTLITILIPKEAASFLKYKIDKGALSEHGVVSASYVDENDPKNILEMLTSKFEGTEKLVSQLISKVEGLEISMSKTKEILLKSTSIKETNQNELETVSKVFQFIESNQAHSTETIPLLVPPLITYTENKIQSLEDEELRIFLSNTKDNPEITYAPESFKSFVFADNNSRDNLTKIEGIGPKIAELLNNENIWTFTELAITSVERLQEILENGGARFMMHNPENWPIEASELMTNNQNQNSKKSES